MTKPTLTYFDAPVSRGEECRIALHLAGIEFHDNRIKGPDWPALKPTTPYGAMPILDWPGKPKLAHSNAILTLIGRMHDLHPKDNFMAAHHEGMMEYVEELRHKVGPTISMPADEKKKVREALVESYLPTWGANVEKTIGDGPFFGGAHLNVVDLKLFVAYRWFAGGKVDHIPSTIFDANPKLVRLQAAVADHAGVKGWYARS